MKRAFTLIELLVVIAIIAILAAILFPVFAQAKEAAKKTQTVSNTKQLATSFAIYQTDSDDYFPIATSVQNDGLIRAWPIYASTDYPWNVRAPFGIAFELQWANSTFPYRKSHQLTEIAGAPVSPVAFGTTQVKPENIGLTMNGLLSTLGSGSIESPSVVPLLWPGLGKNNVGGLAHTNPVLYCGTANPRAGSQCRYNPGGLPGYNDGTTRGGIQITFTGAGGVPNNHWVHSGGTVVARTDTSARFVKIGSGTAATLNNNPFGDMWAAYSTTVPGQPTGTYYVCNAAGGASSNTNPSYPCYFSPNRTQ